MPVAPPFPLTLETTKFTPEIFFPSLSANTLALKSVSPPAPAGTTISTFFGHFTSVDAPACSAPLEPADSGDFAAFPHAARDAVMAATMIKLTTFLNISYPPEY